MEHCLRSLKFLMVSSRVVQWHQLCLTFMPALFQRDGRVHGMEGVGTLPLHKFDQRLFRRATRDAQEVRLRKGEFAYDVVLLACSR